MKLGLAFFVGIGCLGLSINLGVDVFPGLSLREPDSRALESDSFDSLVVEALDNVRLAAPKVRAFVPKRS
jgi:hypothetical protein